MYNFVKSKLLSNDLVDEKQLHLICSKFTQHLGTSYHSNLEETMNSYKSNHMFPPILYTSNIEMKDNLMALAEEHGLKQFDALDTDEGHQFSYQVSGLFPTKF